MGNVHNKNKFLELHDDYILIFNKKFRHTISIEYIPVSNSHNPENSYILDDIIIYKHNDIIYINNSMNTPIAIEKGRFYML